MRPPQQWPANVPVESRCFYVSDPYSTGSMEGLNQQLAGQNWRLVYVNHYTTSKRLNYPTLFCFERPTAAYGAPIPAAPLTPSPY